MPAELSDRVGMRLSAGERSEIEALYTVRGTEDEAEALEKLINDSPPDITILGGKVYRKGAEVSELGGGLWEGVVRYQPAHYVKPTPLEVGQVAIRASTKGGSQHITQSLATVSSYSVLAAVPDHKGAIGVSESGGGLNVEGVDIAAPVFNFSVVKVFAKGGLPSLGTIYGLTGKVHVAAQAFTVTDTRTGLTITLQSWECLFLGADIGDPRGDEGVEISYEFAASPNRTNIPVGTMTVAAKAGWDYLWVLYADAEDGAAKVMVKRPLAAYVERVYQSGDFSGLGL